MALPKMGEKLNGIMAMSLPKMRGKKNVVVEICEEILKKVLRSQYFYNTIESFGLILQNLNLICVIDTV